MNDDGKVVNAQRTKEEWRVLPYDTSVKISNLGRVKRKGKLSKAKCKDKDGYRRIKIKGKSFLLHRLVAELFVPNPDNLPVVDHINNIHDDNRWDNLRWTTPAGNTQFAAEMGLLSTYVNRKSVVIAIDKDNNGYLFTLSVDAAREFDLDSTRISSAIAGKAKTVGGYKFIRVDELIDKRRNQEEKLENKKVN